MQPSIPRFPQKSPPHSKNELDAALGSALVLAVEACDIATAAGLTGLGADIEHRDRRGVGVLETANLSADSTIVLALLSMGADHNAPSSRGIPLWAELLIESRIDCLELPMALGIDPGPLRGLPSSPLFWGGASCNPSVFEWCLSQFTSDMASLPPALVWSLFESPFRIDEASPFPVARGWTRVFSESDRAARDVMECRRLLSTTTPLSPEASFLVSRDMAGAVSADRLGGLSLDPAGNFASWLSCGADPDALTLGFGRARGVPGEVVSSVESTIMSASLAASPRGVSESV